MSRKLQAALAITLSMLSGCGGTSAGSATPSVGEATQAVGQPDGKRTSTRLSAASGGLVEGPAGTELFIPPGVLTADGPVTITVYGDDTVDFHIGVPWTGEVQVRLPTPDAGTGKATMIGHRVRDHWGLEDSYYADGHVTAWVDSLSLFKKIACFRRLIPKDIVKCLIKEGIKDLPTSQAKKLGFEISDCGDVLDLNTWLGDGACRAGDPPTPWPTFKPPTTRTPPPAPPPEATPPAPAPPPAVPRAVTHYDCPTDNGNKGIYVGPGRYWRSDPFTAKGSRITGGFVLIGAHIDGNNHQARVGIYRSADLSAPLSTVIVNVTGYDGESFTLAAPATVSVGETLYLTVVGIGGFTAYDRVDSDCFIGRVDGTT